MNQMIILIQVWIAIMASLQDLQKAEDAIARGEYRMAEAYLIGVLDDEEDRSLSREAQYHLCRLYSETRDFLPLLTQANAYLADYHFDQRGQEVFQMLLEMFCERHAYTMAFEYIKNYDFLVEDDSLLRIIAFGLLSQGNDTMTDYILSLCAECDTILSLRAALVADPEMKLSLYSRMSPPRRNIYLARFYLQGGDTVSACEIYLSGDLDEMTDGLLYSWTKLAYLFNVQHFKKMVKDLRTKPGYEMKAALLSALHAGKLPGNLVLHDSEECSLLVRCLKNRVLDWTWEGPPLALDSVTLDRIAALKDSITDNYYLDSLHARVLLREGNSAQAYQIMREYLDYVNTVCFARFVRAQHHYDEGEYAQAAKDLILAQRKEPESLFKLAHSFDALGKDPLPLYEEVKATSQDTLLDAKVARRIMVINFRREEYQAVITCPWEIIKNESDLVKLHLYSLAATGAVEKAESLCMDNFGQRDPLLVQYYGDHLIREKRFKTARRYHDSLQIAGEIRDIDRALFNWALVPFLQEEFDTAMSRLGRYIDAFPRGEAYHKAFFKIATGYYLQQKFDSAAYYYGIASSDGELRDDALRNQLVCMKKAGLWQEAVVVAESLLPSVSAEEEPDLWFDIGYAYLRSGNARAAIENLTIAMQRQSTPEYHYWLAEAYLTKGDFLRSLWQYQKVVDLFPKDDMWMPTAWYKTGIVLEFLDELDAAQKVYRMIIRARGSGDTWSREARQRLEELE